MSIEGDRLKKLEGNADNVIGQQETINRQIRHNIMKLNKKGYNLLNFIEKIGGSPWEWVVVAKKY